MSGGGGGGAAAASGAVQAAEIGRQFDITRTQLDPYRLAGLPALNLQLALMGLPQITGEMLQASAGGLPSGGGAGAPSGGFIKDPATASMLLGGIPFNAAVASGAELGTGVDVNSLLGGMEIPTYTPEQAMQLIQATPGQQFLRERATEGLLRQQAALGGLGGGQVRSELQQQAIGFAQEDLQNTLARLSGLTGMGQSAAALQGQIGQQAAGDIGAARASGILGAQQASAQNRQQNMQMAGMIASLAMAASDARVKHDIKNADLKACYDAVMSTPLKAWRYLEKMGLGQEQHIGPMAQDAPEMIRVTNLGPIELLSVQDELMMIAGALQYMKQQGMIVKCQY